ncbi:MAG: hypothetical protein PUC30_10150 [Lachnospiraceae bacterium]|nr:hypothetical protein [Lachnospiraceae bacterium]
MKKKLCVILFFVGAILMFVGYRMGADAEFIVEKLENVFIALMQKTGIL